MAKGENWARAMQVDKHHRPASAEIPLSKGVYIWFRRGRPQYTGSAVGGGGLRDRVPDHLTTGLDLSHSTLRATVAAVQLGIPRGLATARPSVMTPLQVEIVNQWMDGCKVGWIECGYEEEAKQAAIALEKALLAEWRPPLNLR